MATDPGSKARGKLLELEKRRQMAVVSDFARIRDRLEIELRDLLERIEKERRIDGNASPGLLLQKARIGQILDAVDAEIEQASRRLAALTSNAQNTAIAIARDQSEQYPQLTAELGFFDGDAVREIIGNAGDGGPLVKTFAAIASPMRQAMFDAIEFGLAAGSSNQQIAAEVRDAIGSGTARAMTIVRTETNRAYREATRKFYEQAPGVIGWRWLAALDLRTCPICWALHGQVFKTKTHFGTHPNCRCTMVPVFAGEAEFQAGPAIFRLLNGTQQKAILGPKRYQMFLDGAELKNFVGQIRTPFGIGRVVKPLDKTKFTKLETPRVPIEPAGPPTGGGVPIARPLPPRSPSVTPPPALGSTRPAAGTPVPDLANTFEATRYMENRFPRTKFDFAGVGIDKGLLQKNVQRMTTLLDEFPGVADRLKYAGTYTDRAKIPRTSRGRVQANAYAHAANDGSYLAWNTRYYSNPAKLRADKKRGFEIGWSASGEDDSTTTHEFGHLIHAWLEANKHKSLFPAYFADGRTEVGTLLNRIFRKYGGKTLSREVSDYAKENRKELFAEGFSFQTHRKAKDWPQFVKAQKALIERANSRIYEDDEITEFRDLSDADKQKARDDFAAFLELLGLE